MMPPRGRESGSEVQVILGWRVSLKSHWAVQNQGIKSFTQPCIQHTCLVCQSYPDASTGSFPLSKPCHIAAFFPVATADLPGGQTLCKDGKTVPLSPSQVPLCSSPAEAAVHQRPGKASPGPQARLLPIPIQSLPYKCCVGWPNL